MTQTLTDSIKQLLRNCPNLPNLTHKNFTKKTQVIRLVGLRNASPQSDRIALLFCFIMASPLAERSHRILMNLKHLPYWTKAQAEKYFIDVMNSWQL